MKERLKMVSLHETGRYTVTELAQQFRVSRKTVHKWLGRFADEGSLGLDERSRATPMRPAATAAKPFHMIGGFELQPVFLAFVSRTLLLIPDTFAQHS